MGKHLITVEVDTDRNQYGTAWGAEGESGPPHADSHVAAYVSTFGGEPGAQWDQPPFTRVVSIMPHGEPADGEGVHADLGVIPYTSGAPLKDGTAVVPLHRLSDGEVFADASGKRWRKRHAGPTQSGVRVETVDGGLWQDFDLGELVEQIDHEHTPLAGSKNRLTADTVEYQCDACGQFYGVAE